MTFTLKLGPHYAQVVLGINNRLIGILKTRNATTRIIMMKQQPILDIVLVHEKARQPTRGTAESAGYDLYSCENKWIKAKSHEPIDIGIQIALPKNTLGLIAPRSGLSFKYGIDTSGIIDEDYRGTIKVILYNHSNEDFEVKLGSRIAQFICTPVYHPQLRQIDSLDKTARGHGGFGSTGL